MRLMPCTLPSTALLPKQRTAPYGLGNNVPHTVTLELEQFGVWSQLEINLERDERYLRAVQSPTILKQQDCIKVSQQGVELL